VSVFFLRWLAADLVRIHGLLIATTMKLFNAGMRTTQLESGVPKCYLEHPRDPPRSPQGPHKEPQDQVAQRNLKQEHLKCFLEHPRDLSRTEQRFFYLFMLHVLFLLSSFFIDELVTIILNRRPQPRPRSGSST